MAWYTSKNKYGAKKTSFEGIVYDSKMEADFAVLLSMRLKAKDIKGWERQKQIELYYFTSSGQKIFYKKWKVDFLIFHNDGTKELAEVKGFPTPDFLIKETLLKTVWLRDNPGYTYKRYERKAF